MAFDYGHTCPDINDGIENTKDNIEAQIVNLIDEISPLFDGQKKDEFVKGYVQDIYSDLEHSFEGVRSSNEDMRKEADYQIDNLSDELEQCKDEISDLQDKITELKNTD